MMVNYAVSFIGHKKEINRTDRCQNSNQITSGFLPNKYWDNLKFTVSHMRRTQNRVNIKFTTSRDCRLQHRDNLTFTSRVDSMQYGDFVY
jgi:hypothetical protein